MTQLILASGSRTRQKMLADAGVPFTVEVPRVDEDGVKAGMKNEGAKPGDVAEALAELKATRVSRKHPEALVVGADQMLACEGLWYDKPHDIEAARAQLHGLRGRTHELVSCAVVVQGGKRIWHHIDSAKLTMRPFSEDFLSEYLEKVGEDATHSVGGYQIEGLGAQLFTHVRGDYFTILGMPLLPLLDVLRNHGVLTP
ncbi:Septum formation protein Maf [Caenispirillum salinarum AK4]|uniref:Nucleoside triphosphate pyrophosphatase n=1 Tax=Caenispirillum salinarum AK4 TaxID=1238182 RepID=K9H1R7_9PROT|nr:Maf family nucleotide pyrophosphatase [Caenispirillum salinarum]EKV32155.1 Septum formation protein Maf [Caenispirillum salinarum AK4]